MGEPWKTTISLCASGVLKLSFLSSPQVVYRGPKEDDFKLPDSFVHTAEKKDGFAGGVELAFMSTTPSAEVAVFYAGTGKGSIFVVEFSMASRGANIAFLSQFPHECELLFPPFTLLECKGHTARGGKRLVLVEATVSTNLPDTARITNPDTVPG